MSKIDNKDLIKKSQAILQEMGFPIKTTQMYEFLSKLHGEKNWNIAKNKDINFSETLQLISNKFSTGNSLLDSVLYSAGLSRNSSNIIIGSTNAGKTNLVSSIGSSILKETNSYGINYNHKVLHICLDSEDSTSRYLSNLSGISIDKILRKDLSSKEIEQLQKIHLTDMSRLRINHNYNFDYSVSNLQKYIDENFKDFEFDVLIIDGLQLFASYDYSNKSINSMDSRQLHNLACHYNCSILSSYNLPRFIKEEHDVFEYLLRHHSELIRTSHSMIHVKNVIDHQMNLQIIKGSSPEEKNLTLFANKLPYNYRDKFDT